MLKVYKILVYYVITISGIMGNRSRHVSTTTTAKPSTDLLSKFHENDFKLVFERSELGRIDRKMAHVYIPTYKYNRTTAALNCSGFLFFAPGYDLEVIVQSYRFASNEYRLFPMRFQFNFCKGIASSAFGLAQLITNGNFVCPLSKGMWYNVTNFTPDAEKFPPLIPNGHYMLELEFWFHSKEAFSLKNYGIIDRPIAIPP